MQSYQKKAPSQTLQTNKRWNKSLEKSQQTLSFCLTVQKHLFVGLSQQNLLFGCLKKLCLVSLAAFDSSADITGLPVQSLTTMSTLHKFFLLCLCLPLCLPLSLLCVSFFLSPFLSQTRVITMESLFRFCKSFSLISSQTNTAPFSTTSPLLLSLFFSLSLYSCLPKALFGQTNSPVILNIPTFLSTFRFSLAAWIVLIASFGLRGHPLACYCGLHYEQRAGIIIQQCRSTVGAKHRRSQQFFCDLL